MEEADWMNEEVSAEIADLQRTHGLEGDEAVAFWHLMQARELIVALAIDRNNKLTALREKEYESLDGGARAGRQIADAAHFGAEVRADVSQHFDALYKWLGHRVLSRHYREGWDWQLSEAEDAEKS